MGTWGEGLTDNDEALDLVARWDALVGPVLPVLKAEGVWALFRELHFNGRFNYLASPQNSELFALAALFAKHDLRVPRDFASVLERAITAELRPAVLREWPDPKARKEALNQLLKEIGGRRQPVSTLEDSAMAAEIQELGTFLKDVARWADVVTVPKADDDFDRLYPTFFDHLERTLTAGIPKPREDTEQETHLLKLRLMLLAFHFGWKARLPPEEIKALVKKAEATNGYLFLAPDN